MKNGANVWIRADECLIISTIFLFLIPFAVIGFGSGEDDEQVLVLFTLLLAVPIAFVLMLVTFICIQQTYQVKPEAWAIVIFRTCNVTISTEYGVYLLMYVIAVCGVLVVTAYGGLCYFGFNEYLRYSEEIRQNEADISRNEIDSESDNESSALTNSRNTNRVNYGFTSGEPTDSSTGVVDGNQSLLPSSNRRYFILYISS